MIIIVGTIIALSVLALLVLLFTVRARVRLIFHDELSLTVSFLGLKLFSLPQKEKKYKLSDYTPKKIAKRDKKKAKKEAKKAAKKKVKQAEQAKKKAERQKLSKAEKKAQKATKPTSSDTVSLFSGIIKLFFGRFFGKAHFHVAKIRINVGSSDAATTAMLYCAVCTAIKPILILLDKHSNLHGMKNADINISADYLREDIEFDVDLAFSMSIGAILGVLLRVLFSALLGWIKIQPAKPDIPKPDNPKADNHKADKDEGNKIISKK